jgi:murein DD-endopeptidase MepM/ murein hydrolase activator NlpD
MTIVVRIMLAILLLMPLTSITVQAEDASVLLRKYGFAVSDPKVEGEKLKKLEEDYSSVARKVNNQTMLSAAYELMDQHQAMALKKRDAGIYALIDELDAIELRMRNNLEADVKTIVALDAEYRATANRLQQARDARNEWLAKSQLQPPAILENAQHDKQKLDKLSKELARQKVVYERALSYPELGEITKFRIPLASAATMTSPFGERLDPITREDMTLHAGIDWGVPTGTPVLAAFNGVVEASAYDESLGEYVLIDHGAGIKTLYGHLDRSLVTKGQQLNQYDVIAYSGNTGQRTTGPHLHFGLYIGGRAVNPEILIQKSEG